MMPANMSRGTMGVNVKSVVDDTILNFRIDDQGEVLSIKFSEDNRVLAIQRNNQSVDFLNFKDNCPIGAQYSQSCKNKSAALLGFVWCSNYEILFITNEQLELYQVLTDRNSVRLNKCVSLNTDWFLWNPDTRICLTCGPEQMLHIFNLKTPATISKGSKFQLPTSTDTNSTPVAVERKHCFLALLYNNLYFCAVRYVDLHEGRDLNRTVCFYAVKTEDPVVLTHVLILDSDDSVSFSLLDNLFMVHYQKDKVTSVYDIAITGTVNNNISHHKPILKKVMTAPFSLPTKVVPALSANLDTQFPVDLYSTNWIINLCGVVIDNNLGCSWLLCLDNSVVSKLINNHNLTIEFLLHRSNGKSSLLDYCSKLMSDSIDEVISNINQPPVFEFNARSLNRRLDQFVFIFKRICKVSYCMPTGTRGYHMHSDTCNIDSMNKTLNTCSSLPAKMKTPYEDNSLISSANDVVTQSEIYTHIFLKNQRSEHSEVRKFLCSVVVEYIRVFLEHNICVEHCFYELLVSLVARIGNYIQYSYYIQSRLIADSKPIALQLLSLETVYPPAGQLAIDMLKRLDTCNSELFDALLIKQRPLEALRFSSLQSSANIVDTESMYSLLDTAEQDGDSIKFHCVYHYLKEGNSMYKELFRDTDERFERFTKHYNDTYS
uniref:Mic1 domain-containing protein n=1 Tax=Trichobilharzia regenti TaxID=157069 RepID=A0AA85JVC3_TRIRE|nr:unnamed protein product [Trichobilharzia regenti]